jgi:hypothetical protein
MKTSLSILLAIILFAGLSCQDKMDIEKEKEAIKAVIEEETQSYLDNDFKELANAHLQDETTLRISAWKDGYQILNGWKAIGDSLKSLIEADTNDVKVKFTNSDYLIKIYPQSAWAAFTQIWSATYEGKDYTSQTRETRFLEKVKGEWKIVFLLNLGTSSYDEAEEMPDSTTQK